MKAPLIALSFAVVTLACAYAVSPQHRDGAAMPMADSSTPTEIAPGKLRSELFDLARGTIEEQAGRAVKFQGSLKRVGDWAFFLGVIVDASGREIKVGEAESADTCALWRKTGGEWKLVQAATGFTDVIYLDFAETYGAPAALFN